jgi:tetratricopeptide (TPR) repeat protein
MKKKPVIERTPVMKEESAMKSQLTLLKEARSLAKSRNYKKSAQLFADYLEKQNDDNPQILLELGFALLLAGDEDGALRIYEALSLLIKKVNLPEKLTKLWHKYDHLIGGTKRKLVLTGVTAVLLSGTACGSQPPVHSSHRYSGGVMRPTIEEQMMPEKPVTGNTGTSTITKEDLRPYSGHKYSGGVLSSDHLQYIHGLIDKETSTKPSDNSTSPAVSSPSTDKTTSTDSQTVTTSPAADNKLIKPDLPDFNLKPISAHRYSGGVYMDFKSQFRKEKNFRMKPLSEDDE